MNWLDIIILVLIVITTLTGLKTGIIKAVFYLVGVIVGVILAGYFHADLAGQLTFIPQASLAGIVAFAIILVVVMIIAAVSASLLKWVASAMMLGWINRLGGAAFGFILGSVFCGALLAIWAKLFGVAGTIEESSLATLLLHSFPIVLALLPDDFDAVRSFFQ